MSVKTAERITGYYISKGVLKEEEREIYEYCFELFLGACINFAVPVVAAILTGRVLETVLYAIGFWPVRVLSGGYHAKTPGKCFIMTQAFYLAFLGSAIITSGTVQVALTIIFAVVGIITVFWLAPIQSENKPIKANQLVVLKKKSRITISAVVAIIFIGLCFGTYPVGCYSLAAGLAVAAASLILAKNLR